MSIEIICDDCLNYLCKLNDKTIDVVVTSPPYNLNINYASYKDDLSYEDYLKWCDKWAQELKRLLKEEGSFFINLGWSSTNPWVSLDVANVIRKHFVLQNRIAWVKSIAVNDDSYGHFKPLNSNRFLNNVFEDIFHFTHCGKTSIDKKSIGVPFKYKSNIRRFNHESDLRCRGNAWYIPYKTVQDKKEKGNHPAVFPVDLPKYCIKLHGFNQNTTVLDLFGGIGSTALACKELGCNCISVELDENYCEIARNRLF